MSDNYSNEMFDIIGRSKKLRSTMFQKDFFSKGEIKMLDDRSHYNIMSNIDKINDDLDLAILITNGGLVYKDNKGVYNLGITQALLAKEIETTYAVKPWFMHRDEDKDIALYEYFANDYFDKMFGDKGKRQLFSGDSKGFMDDFRKYGATDEEILDFDRAINNSVFNGEYILEDFKTVDKLCEKVSKGRKLYENLPKEEKIDKTTGFVKGSEDYNNYYFPYEHKKVL